MQTFKLTATLSAFAASSLVGCVADRNDDAPYLADEYRPDLARQYGLGQEIELTQRMQLVQLDGAIGLRSRPITDRDPIVLGYISAGTRLRVQHVWVVPPEAATPRIGTAVVTYRVVPDHDPLWATLSLGQSTGGWEPLEGLGAGYGNVYTLPASHTRLVPPEERTPDDQIKPLTKRQEWPRGWQR